MLWGGFQARHVALPRDAERGRLCRRMDYSKAAGRSVARLRPRNAFLGRSAATKDLRIYLANFIQDTSDTVALDLGDIVVVLEQRTERVVDDLVV